MGRASDYQNVSEASLEEDVLQFRLGESSPRSGLSGRLPCPGHPSPHLQASILFTLPPNGSFLLRFFSTVPPLGPVLEAYDNLLAEWEVTGMYSHHVSNPELVSLWER